jgi:hypothetical protein
MGLMRACWRPQRKRHHSAHSISRARTPERCFAEIGHQCPKTGFLGIMLALHMWYAYLFQFHFTCAMFQCQFYILQMCLFQFQFIFFRCAYFNFNSYSSHVLISISIYMLQIIVFQFQLIFFTYVSVCK